MTKKRYKISFVFLLLVIVGVLLFHWVVRVSPPEIKDQSSLSQERTQIGPNHYQIKNNWLQQNEHGIWETYIEGEPFERGVYIGKLQEELIYFQENAFINSIEDKVPSFLYRSFLKYFLAFYNRDLDEHISQEYQEEIYGISFSVSEDFDFVGPPYDRKLNYHAAHDIGHALQNMGMVVGCTSLSAWGENTVDGQLIMGRNFDFYVGDDFAKNKVIYFIQPNKGYPFVSLSWPGMIGVVSGMNKAGLAISINAAPSEIPSGAKTPISLLAREILQYASNIEEALAIAEKANTFVSENIIIASAEDKRTVVIEKTPKETLVYENNQAFLVCSNHFQSDSLNSTMVNEKGKEETSTLHRHQRTRELFYKEQQLDAQKLANILRDTKGVADKSIGIGNEMAINQLIAHHSIIFKPEERVLWISTSPWQLGSFLAYDLNKIFENHTSPKSSLAEASLEIAADSFLYTPDYEKFLLFKAYKDSIIHAVKEEQILNEDFLSHFQKLNPAHYQTYSILGNYYQSLQNCEFAIKYYDQALQQAIPWKNDQQAIENAKNKCVSKVN